MQIPVFREAPNIKENQLFIAKKSSVEGHAKATLISVSSEIGTIPMLEGLQQLLSAIFGSELISGGTDPTIAMAIEEMESKTKQLLEYAKENPSVVTQ